jgi:hypothetical protein
MKRIVLFAVAALVMSGSMPVFAADDMSKDECLVMSKNCKDEVDSIQQKMKKLNAEIKKGKKVYTSAELKALHQKLKETDEMLDSLMKPGK